MDTYPINVQDPVELNSYGYTANNPVNAVDPSGLVMVHQAKLIKTISLPSIPAIIRTTIVVVSAFLVGTVAVCAATADTLVLCARKGRDKGDNHIVRQAKEEAQRTGQDVCAILAAMHAAAKNKAEKRAIEQAQKFMGCRNREKRRE